MPQRPKIFLENPKKSPQLTPRPELNLEEPEKPSQILAWAETAGIYLFIAIHNKSFFL